MSLNKISLAGAVALGGLALPLVGNAQLNLGLQLANDRQNSIELTTGTTIRVSPASLPVIDAITDRELVCFDQGESATFGLELIDPNNQLITTSNIVTAAFSPDTLGLTLGTTTQCLVLPEVAEAAIDPQTDDLCDANGDGIFAQGSFEDPAADVKVGVRILQAASVNPTAPLQYEILVKNCSDMVAASDVKLRDFFYAEPSMQPVRFEYSAQGGWNSCADPAACALAATLETGYADLEISALAPGATAAVIAERHLDPGLTFDGLAGSEFQIGAFVSDGSDFAVTRVDQAVTENDPPVVTTAQTDFSMLEDAAVTTLADIAATDTDGTVQALMVSSTSPLISVTSPAATSDGSGGLQMTGATVTPVADANGTAVVMITATDDLGGSDAVPITVTITAVNDKPTFSIWAGFTVGAAEFPPSSPPNGLCAIDADTDAFIPATCADQLYSTDQGTVTLPNFLQSILPGGGESGQTTSVVVNSIGGAFNGPVTINPMGDLSFTLSQTAADTGTIQITVTDSQGAATVGAFGISIQ